MAASGHEYAFERPKREVSIAPEAAIRYGSAEDKDAPTPALTRTEGAVQRSAYLP